MDLLDRYLQAVKFFLPSKDQDDIIRELAENLREQIEDRAEERGRRLDEPEIAEILRQHGHPMIVAARYRPRQILIGPVFFPIYLFAMKMGLGISLLVTMIVGAVTGGMEGDMVRHLVQAALAYPGRAFMVFGITTLAFVVIEMLQPHLRLTHAWDPRTLPKLGREEHRMPRLRSFGEMLGAAFGVCWLLLVPYVPFLLLGPVAAFVNFAPIWRTVYPLIVLLALATTALHAYNFARPFWTPMRSWVRLALHVEALILLSVLTKAGELFVPAVVGTVPENMSVAHITGMVNAAFQIAFAVTAIVTLWEMVKEIRRLRKSRGTPDSEAPRTRSPLDDKTLGVL